MAATKAVTKNADGTYSIDGVTIREYNGQLLRKWPWGWQKEDNSQIINNWNMYKNSAAPETVDAVIGASKVKKTTKSEEPTVMIPKIKSTYSSLGILNPLTFTGLNLYNKIAALPTEKSRLGLFSGDLTSLTSRRNWVGQNADYLKSRGWTDKDIEDYKGLNLTNSQRAALNIRLAKDLVGYKDWSGTKPAVTTEVVKTPSQKFVKTGYTSGRPWQDAELQNMEGSLALYLNPTDYNRWMQLQLGRTKPVAYVAPATPVLNANAPRTDIYNRESAVSPRALINPIIAAPEQYEIGSGPITPEAYFKMYPYKASQEFTIVGSTPTFRLKDYYSAKKNGGKINYQKIFK